MVAIHPPCVSRAELTHFKRRGYLRLGLVASLEEIQALRDRIDAIMLGEVCYEQMMMQLDPSFTKEGDIATGQTKSFKGATLSYRKIQDLEQDPVFRAYMQKPLFRDITMQLIGEEIAIYRAMFMNKPANGGSYLPWHQDGASYDDPTSPWAMSIAPQVTIWTALDPSTVANGCLQVIPGTHTGRLGTDGDFLTVEEIERYCDPAKKSYIELAEGEAVLLHNWTLHSSAPNATDRPRRGFSVCYIDAATRQTGTGAGFPKIFPEYDPVEDKALVTVEY